jgi:hypothetical protein
MRKGICIFLFSVTSFNSWCQDIGSNEIIEITKPIVLSQIGKTNGAKTLVIEKKTFHIPIGTSKNDLFDCFQLDEDGMNVFFSNCSFSEVSRMPSLVSPKYRIARCGFDHCIIESITLKSNIQKLSFHDCIINSVEIDSSEIIDLGFTGNTKVRSLDVDHCKGMKINFENELSKKDTVNCDISNSIISQFSYTHNFLQGQISVIFTVDSVYSVSSADFDENGNVYGNKINNAIFRFNNSFINAPFNYYESNSQNTILEFNECDFGAKTSMLNLDVSQVTLNGCRNIPFPLRISFNDSLDVKGKLQILNSDISNLDILWNDHLELYFDIGTRKDVINNTCEKLLAKYSLEGRTTSKEAVDIQYRNYHGFALFNFFNYWWWGYGYKPYRVAIWTFFCLLGFFLFNHRYWNEMQEAYPLFDINEKGNLTTMRGKKKRTWVVVYTILIFFTFRVSLEKLNQSMPGFTLFFIIQYLTGLFFTFFILRVILGW